MPFHLLDWTHSIFPDFAENHPKRMIIVFFFRESLFDHQKRRNKVYTIYSYQTVNEYYISSWLWDDDDDDDEPQHVHATLVFVVLSFVIYLPCSFLWIVIVALQRKKIVFPFFSLNAKYRCCCCCWRRQRRTLHFERMDWIMIHEPVLVKWCRFFFLIYHSYSSWKQNSTSSPQFDIVDSQHRQQRV